LQELAGSKTGEPLPADRHLACQKPADLRPPAPIFAGV